MFFDAIKATENMRQVIARNADAIVADPYPPRVVCFIATNFNAQTRAWVLLERIFDEVEKNLCPVEAITVNEQAFFRQQVSHIGVLVADHRLKALEHIVDA